MSSVYQGDAIRCNVFLHVFSTCRTSCGSWDLPVSWCGAPLTSAPRSEGLANRSWSAFGEEKYGKIDKDNDALSKKHFVGVRGNRYLLDRSNRMKVGESHEQRPCRSEANSSPVETVGRWPAIGYGPVGVHRSDQMP